MATAKRKQEELGDECDDQEQHDNECSDDDDAKRPRLDIHHQHLSHHQMPHHRQWSSPAAPDLDPSISRDQLDASVSDSDKKDELDSNEVNSVNEDFDEKFDKNFPQYKVEDNYYNGYPYPVPTTLNDTSDVPFDLSNWQVRSNKFDPSGAGLDQASSRELDQTDRRQTDQNDPNDQSDQGDQPINFAYYHFWVCDWSVNSQ